MNKHQITQRSSRGFFANPKSLRMISIILTALVSVSVFLLMSHRVEAANKFWIATGPGNFNDNANWSLTSGGPPDTTAPGPSEIAFFDANGAGNCTITADATVAGINIGSGYTGTITLAGVNLTVGTSDFVQAGGTFDGGSGTITFSDIFSQTGGTFIATSGTILVNGATGSNLSKTGGTFDANGGTIIFDNGSRSLVMDDPPIIFFNFTKAGGGSINIIRSNSTPATAVVTGTTSLLGGILNSGGPLRAEGDIIISPSFGGGVLELFIAGDATRTITMPAGATMPRLRVDAPNVTLNTSGTGTVAFSSIVNLTNAAAINTGDVNLTFNGAVTVATNFTAGTGSLTFNHDLTNTAGTFNAGSGATILGRLFNLTGGTFIATSGTTLVNGGGGTNFTKTGGTFDANGGSVIFDNGARSLVIDNAPITFFNFTKAGVNLMNIIGTSAIAVVTGTANLNGGSLNTSVGGTLRAEGNVNISSTFGGGSIRIDFTGSANQTYTNSGGVNPTGTWTINKPSGKVTLASNLILGTSQALNITSGTLDLGPSFSSTPGTLGLDTSFNLTAGAITIGANGTLRNFGTGNLTLGGNLTNNGLFNFNGGSTGCGDANDGDPLLIRSSVDGAARSWSGTGMFSIVDVDLKDQNATPIAGGLTAFTSTDSGNNTNWTFSNTCPVEVTTDPTDQIACTGASASLTVAASGSNLSFQWRKNGINLADGGNISGATTSMLTIDPTAAADSGSYDVIVSNSFGVTDASASATLTLFAPPQINTPPANATRCVGAPVTFSVTATGDGLAFQWRMGGQNIDGATSSSFTIDSVAESDAGSYDVVVTGSCGLPLISSAATLTVEAPPSINTQPSDQMVCSGSLVMFSVTASGSGLSFQWRRDGVSLINGDNISGANTSTLTINPAQAADAGAYDVVVTGSCPPSVTSKTVALNIDALTLSSTSRSFPALEAEGSVDVIGSAACAWTAVSNDPDFITITAGDSGSGDGTVSYSITANTASSPRSGTITIAGQTYTVFQGILFNDVPVGHLFFTEIGKLSARRVTLGCGGGNYCPDQSVTREQMAAFIIRALGDFDPPEPAEQRFNDVPPTNPFYRFIEQMAGRQITVGCGGGNYCPSDAVLREQMAAFIIRALGDFDPPEPDEQRFLDVPPSNPFYRFIEQMAVRGITLGCGGGNYCPTEAVTRAQMAAFLVRAFDL